MPADVARFSGAWGGVWTGRTGAGGPCTTLVVEEVFANGYARVVYSIGVFDPNVRLPRYWRASGRIVNGVLSFSLPAPSQAEYTFRPVGTDLAGTYKEGTVESVVTAAPIADVGQIACPQAPAVVPPSGTTRDRILASELLATWIGDGPVYNDYFMPIGDTAPARHSLSGTLTIPAMKLSSAHDGCAGLPTPSRDFTIAFLTHVDHLVPAIRTIIWSSDRRFGIILSPGRIWSEPGDQGLSRASFPFAIVNPIDNGTLNGLATFVFDDARVSNLRVQITQETMPWARYDYWGQVPMTYERAPIPDEARLRAQFESEQRLESPIKPWSALPVGAPSPALDAFDGSAVPDDISVSGFVIDGVVYARDCHTRSGPYPYCRHMRHGVFSVTKSLGAAVALLRLAAKYGDDVFEEKIAEHVRVTAAHDGWKDVTFADALSMVVPIGDIGPRRDWPDPAPDENQPKLIAWLKAPSAQEKLDLGFSYGRYPWERGEVVRYNTTVTFTLAAAMDAYLKRKEGPSAHLWDKVADEVYRPIGILHAPMMHTVEPDGSRGIPILGFGLTPTIDDLAKLVTLLQARGQHDGTQILSAAKIDEALRSTATGLSTRVPSRFGDQRYHLSFWSLPYRTALGCSVHVPYMWGYGGNFVVLLPNGVSAFRFADGNTHDPETMILAGEAIRPFCASAPAAGPPDKLQNTPLSVTELSAELPGNTFGGSGGVRVFIAPDGRQYLAVGTRVDVGRWRITPAGLYCRTWNVTDGGRERCFHVYRDGETFAFHFNDRWTVLRWTRTRGRPADL